MNSWQRITVATVFSLGMTALASGVLHAAEQKFPVRAMDLLLP